MILDWLTKEGGTKEDPTDWINAIALETHGWPQHILSYTYPAAKHLKANGGIMTHDGLLALMEAGRKSRNVYYKQRVSDFRVDQIRCLAGSIVEVPHGEPAEYKHIMSSLIQEYGQSEAEDLFQKFEQKGLLIESGMGYAVPIPSMLTWLALNYTHQQI